MLFGPMWMLAIVALIPSRHAPPTAAAQTPTEAVERLMNAYRTGSGEQLARVLAPDYTSSCNASYPFFGQRYGGRDDEIAAARRLFERPARSRAAWRRATGAVIRYRWTRALGFESPPSRHRGPTPRYLITLADFTAEIDLGGQPFRCHSPLEWFWIVRGDDLAQKTSVLDPAGWYVQAWAEFPEGFHSLLAGLSRRLSSASTADAESADTATVNRHGWTLALAPAGANPVPARSIAVALTLPRSEPARLDLYDVAGRRVDRIDVKPATPGPHTARLGSDRLAPGAYWVRLAQGAGIVTTKVIVVP